MNRALQRERLAARGLAPSEVELLLAPLPVETVQVTKSGQERTGGEGNFLVAMVFMTLLFIPSLVYGQEVMRGVIQEKTDRVVEILVSSMTPMELLSGKILGMAAVGLTQIAVWMAMGGLLRRVGPLARRRPPGSTSRPSSARPSRSGSSSSSSSPTSSRSASTPRAGRSSARRRKRSRS